MAPVLLPHLLSLQLSAVLSNTYKRAPGPWASVGLGPTTLVGKDLTARFLALRAVVDLPVLV